VSRLLAASAYIVLALSINALRENDANLLFYAIGEVISQARRSSTVPFDPRKKAAYSLPLLSFVRPKPETSNQKLFGRHRRGLTSDGGHRSAHQS
jgi:hypothetical protein